MDEFRFAHVVQKNMRERTETITDYLLSGKLNSMEDYARLIGEIKYIANLKEDIDIANKEGEDDV